MKFGRSVFLLIVLLAAFMIPVSAQGKAITLSWPQEPDSLNPMYTTMTFAGYTYSLFLEGAWDFDDESNPVPKLVSELPSLENGGISEDGTTFTLSLREGMVWSDGAPITSSDFLFTYEMILSEQNAPVSVSPYDRIASITAPDDLTVVIEFPEPYAPWLGLFSFVLPEHVLRPVFEAEGTLDTASWNRNPTVGSGPYLLDEWSVGNFARFVKNPLYFGGEPIIDTIVITFVPDDQTYLANLLSGDSLIGTFVPFNQVPALRDAGLRVEVIPSGYNEGWFLNASPELAHPAMSDVRVRQAVALGFDRFAFVNDVLLGATTVAASWWENTPYANPNLEPVPFDPDAARALLDEAGWVVTGAPLVEGGDGLRAKDGVELRLRFASTTRAIREDMKAVAQQQLGAIGIDVIIESYPADIFFNGFADGGPAATGNYDIATWSSSPGAFPDPDTSRFMCREIPSETSPSGGNWNYYCDPELDALFEQQIVTPDFDSRVAIFHQIDEMIYNAYIWVGVWFDADVWVVNPALENVRLNGQTPFWDVVNWDIAQ